MNKWDWNINHWNWKQKLVVASLAWLVIVLLCWYLIPAWRDLPGGLLILLGAVAVGVVGFFANLVAYLKDPQRENKTEINTGGGTYIHQVTQGSGSILVGRDEIHAETIIQQAEPAVRADPLSLRQAYLTQVYETARILQLGGIDPKAASESKSNLNLAAVYTGLLTQTPEEHALREQQARPERSDPLEQQVWLGRETRKLSALEQLNRHKRLVLLGDPGSGKTTFVNFVALCLAGEALGNPESNLRLLTTPLPQPKESSRSDEKPVPQPWDHGTLLPVRVILRDFAARGLPSVGEQATARHLWDFIATELKTAELEDFALHLRKELQERGGLLLVDGLDEVPEAEQRRVQIKQAVEQFARSFPKCRILVTSRIYAYQKQEWQLNDFVVTTLAPFIPEQIRHFIDRWYAYIAVVRQQNPEDARGRAELLKREVFRNDRLQGLAERPLLLTLMASLHAWRGGNLPEKREALYADTVNLLLDWWESPKTVRDGRGQPIVQQPALAEWLRVDRDRVRELIEELAYEAHRSQPNLTGTADISQSRLVDGLMQLTQNPDVKPARLIEYLSNRAGLLLPRGVGVFTFPHRTFQEYLAACYMTRYMEPEEIAALACADVDRWREVTLLAAARATEGMAAGFWAIIDNLCPDALPTACTEDARLWGAHLAGQALVESINLEKVSERNRQKANRVRDGLLVIVQQGKLPPRERALAGNHLAILGDPRLEVLTCEAMVFCEVPAGEFIVGEYEDQKILSLPGFWIGKYPVTVAQFDQFVQAGGYDNPDYWAEAIEAKHWTKAGYQARYNENTRTGPVPIPVPFCLPNHPAVMVSWNEALAFSRWLNQQLREWSVGRVDKPWQSLAEGKLLVTLPTREQWEKAARGSDGRVYPWPGDFDPNNANTFESGIDATSAVGCFPAGASPCGALDLSGNVWEYDLTDAGDLRGGSWGNRGMSACCADVRGTRPFGRTELTGFRVSLSPAP